jgi:hypothetical protein
MEGIYTAIVSRICHGCDPKHGSTLPPHCSSHSPLPFMDHCWLRDTNSPPSPLPPSHPSILTQAQIKWRKKSAARHWLNWWWPWWRQQQMSPPLSPSFFLPISGDWHWNKTQGAHNDDQPSLIRGCATLTAHFRWFPLHATHHPLFLVHNTSQFFPGSENYPPPPVRGSDCVRLRQ